MDEIDKFADEVYDFTVNEMGWKKDWSNGGCYIHLEASEDELGDLLMCILSVCRNYNIKPSDAIEKSRIKMAEVVANKEKYLIKSNKHI
jgi:NTP pyrophosphatase (non-canonical NTP hydrolase)